MSSRVEILLLTEPCECVSCNLGGINAGFFLTARECKKTDACLLRETRLHLCSDLAGVEAGLMTCGECLLLRCGS